MFGMLDYRAHKLYLIIFFLPNLALVLFATLGLPVINYSVGVALADNRALQILISLVSLVILELVWLAIIYGLISKFYHFLFGLFVDIIPSNGRSEEEAQLVVWQGQKAITLMAFGSSHPSTWTDKLIDGFSRLDWFQSLFYRHKVLARVNTIAEHYKSLPSDSSFGQFQYDAILSEHDLNIGRLESLLCSAQVRGVIVSYSLLLYLIVFQPF
tara:strand:+ start:1125 stop:1763 length:639 start_codon:yes stop_codon:yes gene_type:complete